MTAVVACAATIAIAALGVAACSSSRELGLGSALAERAEAGAPSSSAFVDAQRDAPLPRCPSNECPAFHVDCNGDAGDGCEANIRVDIHNCGGCGVRCEDVDGGALPPYTRAACLDGKCVFLCVDDDILGPMRNCWGADPMQGDPVKGCPNQIACDPHNCGACGVNAPVDPTGDRICSGGNPLAACPTGTTNCRSGGCGNQCRNLDKDPENCGQCWRRCPDSSMPPATVAALKAKHIGFTCGGPSADGGLPPCVPVCEMGASGEDSAATGINGDGSDNGSPQSGAAYVFVRNGTSWTQEAYVKASNAGTAGLVGDGFGVSVSLSADGSHLAVGANNESSSAAGVNGNQADDSASQAGAAYVFARSGNTWAQEAYVKASNPTAFDHFGWAVAFSGDASRLAVAAVDESSNAKGPNGNQSDHSASGAGAVYVFAHSGAAWAQESYLKASNTAACKFGQSIALSSDGATLAVGASMESSSATGINGNGNQTAAPQSTSGAAYVFRRSGTTWSQEAYVKASNSWAGGYFGQSITLSADGNRLAVGSPGDDSGATGINGNQNDGSAQDSGAAYVFSRSGTTWSQDAYVKASNADRTDGFGTAIALSADGTRLAVGAALECSNATGVNGDQSNNAAFQAGAAYVY